MQLETGSPSRAFGSCSARRGVSFQAAKTWKQSTDPDFEAGKNRVLELYDIADGEAEPEPAGHLTLGRLADTMRQTRLSHPGGSITWPS